MSTGCGLLGTSTEEGSGEGFDLSRPPPSGALRIPTLPRPTRRILPGGLVLMSIPTGELDEVGLRLQVSIGRRHGPRLAYGLMYALALAESPKGGRIGGVVDVGYDTSSLWLTPGLDGVPPLIDALGRAFTTVPDPEREALAMSMADGALALAASTPRQKGALDLRDAFLAPGEPAFGGALSLAYQQVLVPSRMKVLLLGQGISDAHLDALGEAAAGLFAQGRPMAERRVIPGSGEVFVAPGEAGPWVTGCLGHLGSAPGEDGFIAEEALVQFLVGHRLPEALGAVGTPARGPIVGWEIAPFGAVSIFHLCLEAPLEAFPGVMERTESALDSLGALPLSPGEVDQVWRGQGARYLSRFSGMETLGAVFGEKMASGRPGTNPQRYIESLKGLSPEALREAAGRVFGKGERTWVLQGDIKALQGSFESITLRPLPGTALENDDPKGVTPRP